MNTWRQTGTCAPHPPARLLKDAQQSIRSEMEGAEKDRMTIDDNWEEIGRARGVIELIRRIELAKRHMQRVLADDGNCTADEPQDSSCPRCRARAFINEIS